MNDIGESIVELTELIIEEYVDEIKTTALGKIENFDPVNMRADVQLLNALEYGGEQHKAPLLQGCLVKFPNFGNIFIRHSYKKGDLVVVGFCHHSIDSIQIDGNVQEEQDLYRKHSIDDGVVLGGWKAENDDELQSTDVDGLLIENKANGSKIVFKDDGTIEVNNGSIISIKPSGEVKIEASTSVSVQSDKIEFKAGSSTLLVDNSGITATPQIESAKVLSNGVVLSTHTHPTGALGQPTLAPTPTP